MLFYEQTNEISLFLHLRIWSCEIKKLLSIALKYQVAIKEVQLNNDQFSFQSVRKKNVITVIKIKKMLHCHFAIDS